jgi:hypothetical protein
MREDVLGIGEVKFQKIRKNDKKRRFKRWRRQSSENPKNDEKRRFKRLRRPSSENPKK